MIGDGVKSLLPGVAFGHTTMVTRPFRSRIWVVSRASNEILSHVDHISWLYDTYLDKSLCNRRRWIWMMERQADREDDSEFVLNQFFSRPSL
jgi:hypothetical protein